MSTQESNDVQLLHFGEGSDLPKEPIRPAPLVVHEEFVLERSDAIEESLPPASSPEVLTIEFDPVVLHTLALLNYQRFLDDPSITPSQIGPVPEQTAIKPALIDTKSEKRLSDSTVENLLRKSVGILCAHVGFQEMEMSAVNVLARIAATRIRKIWMDLRLSDRRRREKKETACTTSLMQALQQQKISSVIDLQTFYIGRIRERRDRLLAYCREGRQSRIEAPQKGMSRKRKAKSASDSDDEGTCSTALTENTTVNDINFLEE